MHISLTRTFTAALAAAFSCALSQPLRAQEAVSIDDALVAICQEHLQPGMAAAVFSSDRIIAVGVTGVRVQAQPELLERSDLMHLGSCTKAITATMIATLVEEGVLWWDIPLAEALPDMAPTMHEDFRAATLEQLLHHRAGIPAFTAGNAPEFELTKNLEGGPAEQRMQFAARVLERAPVHAPGSRFAYSNADYAIAAVIAERATGLSWEDLLAQRVFGPLDMHSAGIGWPATPQRPDQPHGHMPMGQGVLPLPPDHPYRLMPCLAPAGDVHASIEDFARFAQFHLAGIQGKIAPRPDGERPLLSHKQFMKLHLPEGEYAMGWLPSRRGESQLSWHNGSAGTFFALMTLEPDSDIGVVVTSNAGTGAKACQAATQALLERFASPAPTPTPTEE